MVGHEIGLDQGKKKKRTNEFQRMLNGGEYLTNAVKLVLKCNVVFKCNF